MDIKFWNKEVATIMGIKRADVVWAGVRNNMPGWYVQLVIKPTQKQVAKLQELSMRLNGEE